MQTMASTPRHEGEPTRSALEGGVELKAADRFVALDETKSAPTCLVIVPLYKPELDPAEEKALGQSLAHLEDFEVRYLTHEGLSLAWYEARWGRKQRLLVDASYFGSARTYSALLMSQFFYDALSGFDFHLICQTDAIVFRPDLRFWISQGYDYLGAPWPDGWEMMFPTGKTVGDPDPLMVRIFVGNGGLSLRHTETMQRALDAFPAACSVWRKLGNPEDLFFSAALNLMAHVRLPNVATAALFSRELNPGGFVAKVLRDVQPFGAHQWTKHGKS